MALFLLCSQWQGGSSLGLFDEGTNPTQEGPTLKAQALPQAPPPDAITLRGSFSTYELGRIQTFGCGRGEARGRLSHMSVGAESIARAFNHVTPMTSLQSSSNPDT